MNANLLKIGIEIYHVSISTFRELFSREYNIFLIGANPKAKTSLRMKMQKQLMTKKKIKVRLPEEIFIDFTEQDTYDLLSLENMLATSVDAVVMCIESPGSFAELGAFSNHEDLRDKLIVYMDSKYKGVNSFINLGPIKFLKNNTKSKVVWVDYESVIKDDNPIFYNKLLSLIKDIKGDNTSIIVDLNNPFITERLLLSLLYALKYCKRKDFIEIVKKIGFESTDKKEECIVLVDSAIGILSSNMEISHDTMKGYYLTEKGVRRLTEEMGSRFIHKYLDNIRLKVLNLQLRKFWA